MPKIIYGKSEVDTLLNDKQNVLTAGTGITIANDVISASGGSGGMTAHTYTTRAELATDIVAHQNGMLVAFISNSDYTNNPHQVLIGVAVRLSLFVDLILPSFVKVRTIGSASSGSINFGMYPESIVTISTVEDETSVRFQPFGGEIEATPYDLRQAQVKANDLYMEITVNITDFTYYY